VIEQVLVKGWQVEIRLRIPLDGPPGSPEHRVSSKDRLRPLRDGHRALMPVCRFGEDQSRCTRFAFAGCEVTGPRLSIGLEDSDELLEDVTQALNA
jgi:hypothetical protein